MDTITLVKLAQTFADHRGRKLSTVSTYAAGDGKFFKSISGTAGCTLERAARIVDWFSENWPDDLEWPRDIPRPRKKKEAA